MRYTKGKSGIITKIKEVDGLSLYRREWKEPGLPKYVVFDEETGRGMAEFFHLSSAVGWLNRDWVSVLE